MKYTTSTNLVFKVNIMYNFYNWYFYIEMIHFPFWDIHEEDMFPYTANIKKLKHQIKNN